MKLANNLLSGTAVAATSEAVVMGVKSGLDPKVMIDVINAGSGMNTASRDKFPRAILPRTFDFGFATGLMVKDVRLCLEEAKALGMSMEVAEAVGRLWEVVIREMGAESDFTSAIKPIEKAAGGGEGKGDSGRSQPRRRSIHRDEIIDFDARAHHRVLIALDQHFRHQRAGVVGAGLHRAVGAGGHDREKIAGFRLGHGPVKRQI